MRQHTYEEWLGRGFRHAYENHGPKLSAKRAVKIIAWAQEKYKNEHGHFPSEWE